MKSMMLKKLVLVIYLISLLFSVKVSAQIQIDTTLSPQQLVETVLLGGGVSVSNITFNGVDASLLNAQAAKYIGPSSFIDFNEGVLLKTGHAFQVEDNSFFPPWTTTFPIRNINSDADLQELSGRNINNAAIL